MLHTRPRPPALRAAALLALALPLALPCPALHAQEADARRPGRTAALPADEAGRGRVPDRAGSLGAWEAGIGGAVLLGALVAADPHVREGALGVRSGALEDAAGAGRWMGDWRRSLPWAAAGVLGLSLTLHGEAGWARAAAALGGTLAASMANETLNVMVGRSRPLEERGPLGFDPLEGHASFPSGHTAFAFGLAAGIDAIADGWAPSAVAYAAASLTGLSRIYDDKHWLSDVAAGALVGTLVSGAAARTVLRLLEDGAEDGATGGAASPRPTVEPLIAPGALGARLRF